MHERNGRVTLLGEVRPKVKGGGSRHVVGV
jgi:hypothetical protein